MFVITMMCISVWCCGFFFFCKQKTAYEMRISDWSSDVCSSDLGACDAQHVGAEIGEHHCGERAGAHALDFEHLDARQRSLIHDRIPSYALRVTRSDRKSVV